MNVPADLRYTDSHEWVRLEGDVATIGITEHAQELLGDMVFVDLPEVGRKVAAGEDCSVAESVKAASDIYAPISGEIVAVNGEPITFSGDLKDAISKRPEQTITIDILRGGQPRTLTATPRRSGSTGLLGVGIADETISIKPGLVGAATMAVQKNVQYSTLIFQTVWGLITRETSPKQLMGPVAIAKLSGESAQLGWIALLGLMAQISLNLGLLNLLPVPVLDGGHIFIMAMEGVARRDFSLQVKEKMLMAGFVVLLTLMVTVIYNDLMRLSIVQRLVPWH